MCYAKEYKCNVNILDFQITYTKWTYEKGNWYSAIPRQTELQRQPWAASFSQTNIKFPSKSAPSADEHIGLNSKLYTLPNEQSTLGVHCSLLSHTLKESASAHTYCWSRGNSVGTATRPRAGQLRNWGSIPGRGNDIFSSPGGPGRF
jgi:hypothetical protein